MKKKTDYVWLGLVQFFLIQQNAPVLQAESLIWL